MTISTDAKFKKQAVLVLKKDLIIDGETFANGQCGVIAAKGKRIATVRLVTTTHNTYEVVFDLKEIEENFNLAPLLSDSENELLDWSCTVSKKASKQASKQDCRYVDEVEYTLRHKRKVVGLTRSFNNRFIESGFDSEDWKKLVSKAQELCNNLSTSKNNCAIPTADVEGFLLKYICSPLKNHMSIESIINVEMTKRNALLVED